MPDITINESDRIDVIIASAASIDLTVSEASPITVNVTEPAPQIITVYPQLVINSEEQTELVEMFEFGDSSRGTWCEGPSSDASYSYSGSTATMTMLSVAGSRVWLKNSGHGEATNGAASPTVRLGDSDFLYSWKGRLTALDDNTNICLGFFRTHGGGDESDSLERLVGFYNDRTTDTWRASVWRPSVPNTSAYAEVVGWATTASVTDEHSVEVIVCNRGTRAMFYLDGDLVGVANDNLPQSGDNGTSGDKVVWGAHMRDFDDMTVPSVLSSMSITDMKCRQYKLGSFGATIVTSAVGAAGGDLTGTYPNPQIAALAVGTAELAAQSVTTAKIATNAITDQKIANGAVTPTKISSEGNGFPTMLVTDTNDEFTIWAKMNNFSVNYAATPPEVSISLTGISAGGDLTGTYPNPTVHKVHGHNMQSGNPTDGDVWTYHNASAEWQHRSLSSAGISATGHTHTASEITDLVWNYDPCDPVAPVRFWDDFLSMGTEAGEIGTNNWNIVNGTITNAVSEQNHPGNIIVRCSSTANTIATLSLSSGSSSNSQFYFGEWTEMTIVFKCLETDTDCLRQFGLVTSWNTMTPTDGVFIRKPSGFGYWEAVCRAGSTETATGSLWTQDTAWHKIKMVKSGSNVLFYLDGSLVSTVTTNVPASSALMYPVYQNQPTGGSTVRRNQIDFWSFKLNGPTR